VSVIMDLQLAKGKLKTTFYYEMPIEAFVVIQIPGRSDYY